MQQEQYSRLQADDLDTRYENFHREKNLSKMENMENEEKRNTCHNTHFQLNELIKMMWFGYNYAAMDLTSDKTKFEENLESEIFHFFLTINKF